MWGGITISDPGGFDVRVPQPAIIKIILNGPDFVEGIHPYMVTGFQKNDECYEGVYFKLRKEGGGLIVSYRTKKIGVYKLFGVYKLK